MNIVAPRINTNDDQVGLVLWHVADGDFIEKGDDLVDLETSKAVVTIEADVTGYVRLVARKGEIVKVGQTICSVTSEAASGEADLAEVAPTASVAPPVAPPTPVPTALAPLPATSALAAAPAPQPAAINVTVEKRSYGSTRISTQAQALIDTHKLDQNLFKGVGLVTADDVRAALGIARNAPALASVDIQPAANGRPDIAGAGAPGRTDPVPLSKRAEIGALTEGESGTINSTLTVYFNSAAIRAQLAMTDSFDGNIQPIILYELSRVLVQWPIFTSYFDNGQIVYYDKVDIGLAIDLGKGLKVVTLPETNRALPVEIYERTVDYCVRYMENKIAPHELVGSTFTVTDLSSLDVAHFRPLINGKQAAILGVGGDSEQPGHPMSLSLTFDHRVSNGREAANFLKELRRRILSYSGHKVAGPAKQQPSQAQVSAGQGAAPACASCGVSYEAYQAEFGSQASMSARFNSEGGTEAVCHLCNGGWV